MWYDVDADAIKNLDDGNDSMTVGMLFLCAVKTLDTPEIKFDILGSLRAWTETGLQLKVAELWSQIFDRCVRWWQS